MTRALLKLAALALMVAVGAVAIVMVRDRSAVDPQVAQLQDENRQLAQIVDRLTDERRVAEALVVDQKPVNGVTQTTLLFVEYARDGTTLPPNRFVLSGDQAHLDATVIRFDTDRVKAGDPLRGKSIALFTRIFGDHQAPKDGFGIDSLDPVPDYYRGASPQVTLFERAQWADFWRLTEDPALRERRGVRAAGGQGLWWPCKPDQLYTITLESNGGLNLAVEPLKGIYREALRARQGI